MSLFHDPEVVARLRTVKTCKGHSEGKHWNVERSTGQQLLGHNDVATMIYIHDLNSPGISVKSPLDG